MIYAGFWIRFLACILDFFITLLVVVPIIALAKLSWSSEYSEPVAVVFSFLANGVCAWLYAALFESGNWQATPGKRILGLKVTDLTGNRISFGRASGRYFAKIISAIILYIGYVMVGFTEKKQGLHDKLADTLVVFGKTETKANKYEESKNSYSENFSGDTVFVPSPHLSSSADRWVLSGFDTNGDVVRLSFSDDLDQMQHQGLVVGRDARVCDLHLNDLSVSRSHARIFLDHDEICIEDLDSANGTGVNGRRVKKGTPVNLPSSGTLTFGAVELSIAKY